MRNTVINKITNFAENDKNVFIVTGDAGFGVLDEFQSRFRERFLNLGVAEQNTIGFSAGLALAGFKVFIYNIVPFLIYRCFEQVRNDICYQKLPVVLIGIGSGVTYAPAGVTHYSVEDIAIARTLPNLAILSPSDPQEASKCIEHAYRSKSPVYIRLAKSGEPPLHKTIIRDIKYPLLIQEGKEIAVLFHGSIGPEVIKAVDGLNFKPVVISVPMLSPLDFNFLLKQLKNISTIVTIEEHYCEGGLGSIIADWIMHKGLKYSLIKLGIKNEFIHEIKNNSGMRDKYGISSIKIRKKLDRISKNG